MPQTLSWRDAYRRVLNPEILLAVAWVEDVARAAATPEVTLATAERTGVAAGEWAGEAARSYGRLPVDAGDGGSSRLSRAILSQTAPFGSVLGAWLQGMSAPGVFEDALQLRTLALMADDVGVGRPRSSRAHELQLLLHRHGLPELDVDPLELAGSTLIHDAAFALPAALLAFSRRADVFAPQIAGIDLVLRSVGLVPGWRHVQQDDPQGVNWGRLDLGVGCWAEEAADPRVLAARNAGDLAGLGETFAQRVNQGASWAYAAIRRWDAELLEHVRAELDPQMAMAALLRERAREGSVYHQRFELDGRSLSTWLREAMVDPTPLLEVLARHKLVRPGDPSRSPLVQGLVSARGPMFRIFSPEDLSTIRRWIASLPSADSAPRAEIATAEETDRAAVECAPATGSGVAPPGPAQADGHPPVSLREAYYLLQGRAVPEATRTFALEYADRWLAEAQRSLDRTERSLPTTWPTDGLRPWLLDQHDRHGDDYEAGRESTLPSRDQVIDSTLQLAPLTLIDGAWLQGFTETHLAASRVGFPLFHTYWDELGNGDTDLNHPRIYREVLRQMGVVLAPTGSFEFAMDPRFKDESFRLPVYWLCLGKLPITRMPEILGMNLAMELSGVGGSYRQARTVLAHYDFSTRFVDIHNTIDNVSTGHSAWAADSIDAHMQQFTGEADRAATEWGRVRVGYESLDPLPRRGSGRSRYRFVSSRRRGEHRSPTPEEALHHPIVAIGA